MFGYRLVMRRFVPFTALLVVFAISAGMLIDYAAHSVRRKKSNAQLSAQYEQVFVGDTEVSAPPAAAEPTPSPASAHASAEPASTLAPFYHDFSGAIPERAKELYRQNNDLVGWLYIKGVVSLPVVQRDNSFYLNHDFEGKKSDGGALFLDQYHPMSPQTQHLLIHGHNMHDSSMFGIVSSYNKLFMVQKNGFARFSTLYAQEDYVICAVLMISPDMGSRTYFNYVDTPNFDSEADFIDFAKELKERSIFDIPVDMQPSDGLLSLATCSGDDRLLVVFRRIREGEKKDALQQLLSQAAKKPY